MMEGGGAQPSLHRAALPPAVIPRLEHLLHRSLDRPVGALARPTLVSWQLDTTLTKVYLNKLKKDATPGIFFVLI